MKTSLGDAGAAALLRALQRALLSGYVPHLKDLRLCSVGASYLFLDALLEVAESTTATSSHPSSSPLRGLKAQLEVLHIGGNELPMSRLQALCVQWFAVSQRGVATLPAPMDDVRTPTARCPGASSGLVELGLGGGSLDYFALTSCVCSIIRSNLSLRVLDLRGTDLSEPAVVQLIAARQSVSRCSKLHVLVDGPTTQGHGKAGGAGRPEMARRRDLVAACQPPIL